jgi:fermentation-respiration switch protein FrsA (DUF1100 family)
MKQILMLFTLTATFGSYAGLDQLFYHPDQTLYATPQQDGYAFEEIQFSSKDSTQLTGWFVPAKDKALGTVIHFHGNAQNMSAHYSYVSWLPESGFNLFLFDYRGYGKSEGLLSRQGVYEDSVAAVEYIKTRTDLDQNRLILFGQSLGGANAIAAMGENQFEGVVGVVTDSAFSSYKRVAGEHVGLLKPVALLAIRNKWSPKKSVADISPVPLVLIHGTQDRVVSYKNAQVLFKKANGPKQLWTVENGRHTDALGTYRSEFVPRLYEQFKVWVGE